MSDTVLKNPEDMVRLAFLSHLYREADDTSLEFFTKMFKNDDFRYNDLVQILKKSPEYKKVNAIATLNIEATECAAANRSKTNPENINLKGTLEDQFEIRKLLRFFSPQKVLGFEKIRIGHSFDGGYVLLDDFEGITNALSFGISNDDSWDSAIARMGIHVDQYDHSIECSPTQHSLMKFHKCKIGSQVREGVTTLGELMSGHLGSSGGVIIKMDIEGDEWEIFDKIDDKALLPVSQLICEFHGFSKINQIGFYMRCMRAIEKIRKIFIPFHVHANNYSRFEIIANFPVPDVIEVSFCNSFKYNTEKCNEIFPTNIDQPNNPDEPDIFLGSFQF